MCIRDRCYVLERESQVDLAVLNMACAHARLPSPERRLRVGIRRAERAYFELIRRTSAFGSRPIERAPRYLDQLVAAAASHPDFDVDLVPVAIFWGRAPHKEVSLWRLLFTEDWALVGPFRKLLNVIFNGRNTLVYFGEPVRLRDAMQENLSPPRTCLLYTSYEKGRLFLTYLDAKFGRDHFDAFLRGYFDHFAFKSITTEQFAAYLQENLLDRYPGVVSRDEVTAWVSAPGLPDDAVLPVSGEFAPVDQARAAWLGGGLAPKRLKLDSSGWAAQQWLYLDVYKRQARYRTPVRRGLRRNPARESRRRCVAAGSGARGGRADAVRSAGGAP